MKRRWWIILGSAAFAVIGLIVGLSVVFGDPITGENFAKIKRGMTEAEVVDIFGRSADEAGGSQAEGGEHEEEGHRIAKTPLENLVRRKNEDCSDFRRAWTCLRLSPRECRYLHWTNTKLVSRR